MLELLPSSASLLTLAELRGREYRLSIRQPYILIPRLRRRAKPSVGKSLSSFTLRSKALSPTALRHRGRPRELGRLPDVLFDRGLAALLLVGVRVEINQCIGCNATPSSRGRRGERAVKFILISTQVGVHPRDDDRGHLHRDGARHVPLVLA